MNRLTRKTNGKDYYTHCIYIEKTNELFGRGEKPLEPDEYYKQEPYKVEDSYYDEDILVKLGKLEDLEEQLGCPLEVVFKALTERIVFKHRITQQILLGRKPELVFRDNEYRFYIGYHTFGQEVKLSDYQKTWWLPKDKEWQK